MDLKKYEGYLRHKGLKANSIKTYLWHIKKFQKWFERKSLDTATLKKYQNFILHKTDKINSVNLHLGIVNDFLNFLMKKFNFDLLSRDKTRADILTRKQLQLFLDAPSKTAGIIGLRNKAIVEMLYTTGLKVGQLVNLQKKYIDEVNESLILENKRELSLGTIAWSSLKKYLTKRNDDNPYIFINFDRSDKGSGGHISIRSVERIIESYARHLNPPLRISPQTLRNTLAHHLKSEGAQSQEIKDNFHFQSKLAAQNFLRRV